MSLRNKIREYLDSCDSPMWCSEIVAATGCRPQHISGMVTDGALVKHEGQHPHSYSVGVRPTRRTKEEVTEARRLAESKRAARRNAEKMAARRAAGIKARPRKPNEQPTVKRNQIVLASKHATREGESVSDFLARGGSIERLPGFERDGVYARRRPQMNSYRSVA